MKVKASVKPRCPDCYIVRRRKSGKSVVYIYCKKNSRHKQKQG